MRHAVLNPGLFGHTSEPGGEIPFGDGRRWPDPLRLFWEEYGREPEGWAVENGRVK